ncbi:MAG: hypothetical protein IJQ59_07970 [Bacteroidaceae bacterium]|nr:hypothetical protein [Bacteroidaceae bacterium]
MKKEKFLKSVLLLMMASALSTGFLSCSKDDDDDNLPKNSSSQTTDTPVVATVDQVSGSYTGTLKPIGYNDDPARCYVTLTRLSNDAVRLEKLICEEFGLDMNPVNLILVVQSDGSVTLKSETTKSIEGTYYQGKLTLTFSNSIATFYFSGSKN